MKRFWLLFCFGFVVFLLGCGNGNDPDYIRLAWWGNTVRDERTIKVAQLFMEKNPGVTVETEAIGWDGYWSRLNTQAAAGSLPDVMQQDYLFLEQYNSRNLLLDMNPFVRDGTIDLSLWTKDSLAAGTLGGKLIALNLGTNAWGMGVDPAVLERAGVTIDDTMWTWRDFEDIALTVYRQTGVQTSPITETYEFFAHIGRQFGAPFFSSTQMNLGMTDNQDAKNAVKDLLAMMLRLKDAGALYDPEDAFIPNRPMEESPIVRGKTWNSYYFSNQHVGFVDAARRDLGYIIFPSVNGNKPPFGNFLKPSQLVSIVSTSKNQELSARFVNFMLNDLEANRILLAERGIPVPSNVRDDLRTQVDPVMGSLFDFIDRVMPFTSPIDPPDPPQAMEARDIMRPILLRCLLGQVSVDDALTQMIDGANAVLGR